MYKRSCNPLISKSFFLFGARGTGKSTLLRDLLATKKHLWIDLLRDEQYLTFSQKPGHLRDLLETQTALPEWVIVDEIQKVPPLLDEIHSLLEDPKFKPKLKFALTGSSARKLRHGAANLLAGRALLNQLHPLTFQEIGEPFQLNEILRWGSLPAILNLRDPLERQETLRSYVSIYLKEEIRQEQIVRKIEPFMRFLEVAAQCNGTIVNFSKIARDALTDSKSVERYFGILDDTLIGFFLDPWHRSIRKRQSKKPKFYFFDLGVKNALENTLGIPLQPKNYMYGKAFEHFIILECMRLNDYHRKNYRFSYFLTKDDLEVDLICERPGKPLALVEIKSGTRVDSVEVAKLRRIGKELGDVECLFLAQEERPRRSDGVEILPWKVGLEWLFEL